jgi:histidyl-tRNA synthetase
VSEGAAKKEEKPRKFQAIRGTRDLLPPETALWNRVEQTAHEVFSTFGFSEIRLPVIENIELFARSIGFETDIVGKEMFSFEEYGFTALDSFRRTILLLNPIAAKQFKHFKPELHVDRFIEALATSVEKAEITRTPEVLWALQSIPQLRKDLTEALQKESDEDIRVYWGAIQQQVRNVSLGLQICLRPEATASVCRAYIENNMQQLPQPVKLYTIGPMFRRERPQKGRYRQFYQIDAEVLEATRLDAAKDTSKELAKDAAIDAEVIEMVMTFFERVGLEGVQLDINSIGDKNCRPKYVELLRAELLKVKDKLGADSQRRIETNPLRVLDSKLESEQKIIEKLPRIADHLCKDCAEHYAAVKRELHLRGVKYQENWRLVRGLDYYMRTTFEITGKGLGSQNAVCGGGRYDGLVELLGGPPTKGIGFAIGEDRLILSLLETGHSSLATRHFLDVYIAWMGEKAYAAAIRAAKTLRTAGLNVELPPVEQKFGKALGQADKLGAKYALILGDNEVSRGEWTLKTLADGTQQKLTEPQLLDFLKK